MTSGSTALSAQDAHLFDIRLERSRTDLLEPFDRLYGHLPTADAARARLLDTLAANWAARPDALKAMDLERDLNPDWFLRPDRMGYVFYVDRFAGRLRDVLDHLDYLEELGITYLHIMPLLKPRDGDNDGGYSVQDYRAINPAYGTMDDFEEVTTALRARGISTCIDMVLNHTAREHEWAEKARAGDPHYQAYYRLFDDRETPDRFEETLLEIFPDQAPGNFTWDDAMGKWVWTTFNTHQWDLNWENPDVLIEIVDIMLHLANRGAEVLRLDAVAFMWKRLGTDCQNQPEVHDILQILRAACRIAAAGIIHKAEAIVSPINLIPYLGAGRHTGKVGNLAYHNSLMVQFWSSLAARDTTLMTRVLTDHFPVGHRNATWATYLRCHDDIGWAITDEDAGALGFSGAGHRDFLAEFYRGNFEGSFARGGLFQYNPATNDKRSNGALASLAGLEAATSDGERDDAIARILMGHALIASFGGIPLLYMGDEIGLLNDMDWAANSHGEDDSRWMHRPFMDWTKAARRTKPGTTEQRLFTGIQKIIKARARTPLIHGAVPREILETHQSALFAFRRRDEVGALICVFNFSEEPRHLPVQWFHDVGVMEFQDVLGGAALEERDGAIFIPPYAALWCA
ncbi:amylosucrase [Pontivivens insulae]|uniref:Amylosucrase n=1 Tax=Pontivivens insulae TaxID=1639689 RepID=A0A2R8AE09_9RHOB|nr:amylosucrase [Pontivivens insulae]RED14397.1 amylosucrase [Pontivivens insulae]SPF30474.1 Amylosucrase [Pontivivens insulae]